MKFVMIMDLDDIPEQFLTDDLNTALPPGLRDDVEFCGTDDIGQPIIECEDQGTADIAARGIAGYLGASGRVEAVHI